MSDNQEKPDFYTDEQWKIHLELEEQFARERKDRFDTEMRDNPPVPPWIKFPEVGPVDMFWRMGRGEEYLQEYIAPYFNYASEQEIEEYKSKYPEPREWIGWYKN